MALVNEGFGVPMSERVIRPEVSMFLNFPERDSLALALGLRCSSGPDGVEA